MFMIWIFTVLLSFSALGAKHDVLWLKVEDKKEDRNKKETSEEYHYDSLEAAPQEPEYRDLLFWQRTPQLGFGGAFIYDKPYQKSLHDNPYGFLVHGSFNNKGWRRIDMKAFLDARSELSIMGMLQWMPSQKSLRYFYGIGAAIHMQSGKQLKNFIPVSYTHLTLPTKA